MIASVLNQLDQNITQLTIRQPENKIIEPSNKQLIF